MKNIFKLSMLLIISIILLAGFGCKDKEGKENNDAAKKSITAGFPKTMYVIAKAGLRMRSEPSVDSIKIGNYSYGEQIQVIEKSSTPVTIEGVTDYWYKTKVDITVEKVSYKHSWVFGGFLSENAPAVAVETAIKKLQKKGDVYYLNNVAYTGIVINPKEKGCWDCMEEKFEMKDGKRHGKYESSGPGVSRVGNFKNGKMHGEWIIYDHANKNIEHYKDDKKHGEWKYFDSDVLVRTETYKDDVLIKEWEKN